MRPTPERTNATLSFQYDAGTGRPRVADPGFVDALRLLQRLQPHRSPRASAADAFAADEAVLGVVALGELAGLRGGGSEGRCSATARSRIPGVSAHRGCGTRATTARARRSPPTLR